MKEFLTAAAPWVLIGVAVALCIALTGRRKTPAGPPRSDGDGAGEPAEKDPPEPTDGKGEDSGGTYLVEGLSLGMCVGVAAGLILLDNLAVGLSLGMLIGLAIGINIKKPHQRR